MTTIAAHDDAVDDQEHTHREKEMDPAGAIEYERGDDPDDEEANASDDADVHESQR